MSETAFTALRSILARHAGDAVVTADDATEFALARPGANGKPIFLAAVQQKRRYVAVHLFPIYERPAMLQGLSPALRKRMQGKSCFNFTTVDTVLFAELERLIVRALGAS
jgi:hypothetical protein